MTRIASRLGVAFPYCRAALDLLFPAECALCHESLREEALPDRALKDWALKNQALPDRPPAKGARAALCEACQGAFADRWTRCGRCAAIVPRIPPQEASCPCCPSRRASFSAAVCLGSHENHLREAVLRIKTGHVPLAFALADALVARHALRLAQWQTSLVVPVPMHWRRRLERGANSAQLLAERLAGVTGSRFANVLGRRKNAPPQASLPPSLRRENVRFAFRVRRPRRVAGRRVLLVDDVMTTGSTCHEAARTLLAAGAAEVFVAVVARALPPQ